MSSQHPTSKPTWTRRLLLRNLGGSLVLAPLAYTIACSDQEFGNSDTDGTSTSGTSGSESSGGESTGQDTTADTTGDTTTGEDCQAADSWADGGTAAMTAKDCYPDPFTGAASCMLLCQTTEGPCTAATEDRQDVSEGMGGLPVRLALKFVEAETCEPIEGAVVEIWHTQRTGVYSGVTPSGAFCYGNDPDAENHLYFRGSQTTDAQGRVDFDTCFPGWYVGRAIHIHFRVYLGGDIYLTSQVFFDESLTESIFTTHPAYSEFGQPDTVNSSDNIIGGVDDISPYVLDTARMPDGAMLASKVIAVRSSTSDNICSAGMMGGPP